MNEKRELPVLDEVRDEADSSGDRHVANALWIKIMAVGVLALTLGGVAVVFFSSDSSHETAMPMNVGSDGEEKQNDERGIAIPLPEAGVPRSSDGLDASIDVSKGGSVADSSSGSQQVPLIPPEEPPPVSISDLERLSNAVEDRISAMTKDFSDLSDRVRALEERLDAIATNPDEKVSERFDRIEAQLESLDKKFSVADRRSRANEKRLSGEVGARYRGRRLPFVVESIDRWGSTPSVAVRDGDRRRFIGIGDTVAGWRLVSVDPVRGGARFARGDVTAFAEAR